MFASPDWVRNPARKKAAKMTTAERQSKASLPSIQRRLPIGAEVQRDGGVHFRVYAPLAKVSV